MLLSTHVVFNNSTKLHDKLSAVEDLPPTSSKEVILQCDVCGVIFVKKYVYVYNSISNGGVVTCTKCKTTNAGALKLSLNKDDAQYNLEALKTRFLLAGLVLVSEEYIDWHSPYQFYCPKHVEKGIQVSTIDNIQKKYAKGIGCRYCAIDAVSAGKRTPVEEVKERFTSKNCTPLFTEYINRNLPLEFICNYHVAEGIQTANATQARLSYSPCFYCKVEQTLGFKVGSRKFSKNGELVVASLRNTLWGWKQAILRHFKWSCCISNLKLSSHIHHVTPFEEIVLNAHKALGIPRRRMVGEYAEQELEHLKKLVIYFHEGVYFLNGALVSAKLHREYHQKYKNNDNLKTWLQYSYELLGYTNWYQYY